MKYKNITIAGSGVLGSQIAFQTAFKGFNVSVYDINDEALERAKDRITNLKPYYKEDMAQRRKISILLMPAFLSTVIYLLQYPKLTL